MFCSPPSLLCSTFPDYHKGLTVSFHNHQQDVLSIGITDLNHMFKTQWLRTLDRPGFEAQLHLSLAVKPQTADLTTLIVSSSYNKSATLGFVISIKGNNASKSPDRGINVCYYLGDHMFPLCAPT